MLPLVPAMLEALKEEMAQFQRLVTYWPHFGPALESSVCAALRDATAATSRQCGLFQVRLCHNIEIPLASRPQGWLVIWGPVRSLRLSLLPHPAGNLSAA